MQGLKTIFVCLMVIATSSFVFGQSKNYKVYSIQLAAYSKVLDDDELKIEMKRFEKLKDLGLLYETSYPSPQNPIPSKILLGSYLGISTAKRMYNLVKSRGFDGFIVNEFGGEDPDETGHYDIVQLSSTRKPHMAEFKDIFDDYGNGYVVLAYSPKDRRYKAMITCFKDGDTVTTLGEAKKYGLKGWATDVRKIIPSTKKEEAKK